MLTSFFDFQLASYDRLEDVDPEEIMKADLIEIRGYVPGGIYHSQSMLWLANLKGVTSAKDMIRSKKDRKVVEDNKVWFEQQGYHFEIKVIDEKLFEQFEKLYQQTTLNQERPEIFSLKEQILGKMLVGKKVLLIGMFKGKLLESGLVFSVSDDRRALVSFGAKKKFNDRRGGVGGVFEFMLIEYCLASGICEISHGKAKNPAGLTSKAGVFEFKARYGCSAFPDRYWKTTFILNPKIALTDLVFVSTVYNQIAYIVVSDDPEKDIVKKYQTKEVALVQPISFKKAQLSAKAFLRKLKK